MTRCRRAVQSLAAACLALAPMAAAAQMEGPFLRLDRGNDTTRAAIRLDGPLLSYGLAHTDYGSGKESSLGASARLPFLFSGGEMSASAGPVAVYGEDEWSFGVRGGLDYLRSTPYGSLYLRGELDSAVDGYTALARFGLGDRGLGAEVSAEGSEAYDERSAALTFRLPGTPVTLRAGRHFEAETFFAGVSLGTF